MRCLLVAAETEKVSKKSRGNGIAPECRGAAQASCAAPTGTPFSGASGPDFAGPHGGSGPPNVPITSLRVAARRTVAGVLLALVFLAGFTAGAIVVTEDERAAAEAADVLW